MEQKIKDFVIIAINDLIKNSASQIQIDKLIVKHKKKLHFIPIRYRVLGGLLQSMNIKFGNFIERLLHTIVEHEDKLKINSPISGSKDVEISFTEKTDNLIDNYITRCQHSPGNSVKEIEGAFKTLIRQIFEVEKNTEQKDIIIKHDIDVLFSQPSTNKQIYIEVKYNDDHDTGKYVDINRKFIKTYIGLCNILKIYDSETFKPILYFLTPKVLKGNIYIPEGFTIYRGRKLFDEFFSIEYDTVDEFMKNIGEDEKIIKIFDDLFNNIRNHTDI